MAMEINSGTAVGRIVAAIRQQHWLSLALLALHCALMLELNDPLARALLLSHFGFFLLWQPLWRGEQKLIPSQVLLIIGAAVLLIAAGSWWLMALWISVLFSLIGGNVPGIKNLGRRMVSLLAAVYLLSVLLAWVVPHLFPEQDFPTGLLAVVRYGLMIPAAAIFFVRTGKQQAASANSVDLFYSLLLFLLVALSLLWDPRAGFAGIGQLLTRYLLSIGIPFERWMHSLAALAERERDP